MASVHAWQAFDRELDQAGEDEPIGCTCRGDPLYDHHPKGDPLTWILELEQLALDEGFASVHDYIAFHNHPHKGTS